MEEILEIWKSFNKIRGVDISYSIAYNVRKTMARNNCFVFSIVFYGFVLTMPLFLRVKIYFRVPREQISQLIHYARL